MYVGCVGWVVGVYKVLRLTYKKPKRVGDAWHATVHFAAFIGLATVALHEMQSTPPKSKHLNTFKKLRCI